MSGGKIIQKKVRNVADGTALFSIISTVSYFATSYWSSDPLNIPTTLLSTLLATLERLRCGQHKFEIDREAPIILGVLGVRGVASIMLTATTNLSPALAMLASEAIVLGLSAAITYAASEDATTTSAPKMKVA